MNIQLEYAALLARTLPAVIHSEKENEPRITMLEALDGKEEKLSVAERRLAELLTVLIQGFEEKPTLGPARPNAETQLKAIERILAKKI